MNGAALLVRELHRAGVRTIFSLSGNQIMPVYDACIDFAIRIVHVRHEAAAVYMADAWAQVTGEIGVALLTAGPGFANGLSPLYSARLAESPVLLLSGDSPISGDDTGAFQELAQTEISRPLVKHAQRVTSLAALDLDLRAAIQTALSGRQGPVHLALPFDILNEQAPEPDRETLPADLAQQSKPLDPAIAGAIADAISAAGRPVILLGPQHNRSRAPQSVAALEDALGAPIVAMESPRGLRDPALGALADVLARADLIVSLGKAIDFTLGFARPPAFSADAAIVVVDPDKACVERAFHLAGERITISAVADVKPAIKAIIERWERPGHGDWRAEVVEALALRPSNPLSDQKIHPQMLCAAVNRFLARVDDPVLVCDGGEFGQWAQAFCTAPTRIINGMSGAIGGGIAYALAAKIARPDATIVLLMGDGTAGFLFAEFDTAVREGADFIAIIGNDHCWNAEHQIQMRDYGPDRLIGCQLSPEARYDLAAIGLGCHGEYVGDIADLDPALKRAAASGRPACLNVAIQGLAAPEAPAMKGRGAQ